MTYISLCFLKENMDGVGGGDGKRHSPATTKEGEKNLYVCVRMPGFFFLLLVLFYVRGCSKRTTSSYPYPLYSYTLQCVAPVLLSLPSSLHPLKHSRASACVARSPKPNQSVHSFNQNPLFLLTLCPSSPSSWWWWWSSPPPPPNQSSPSRTPRPYRQSPWWCHPHSPPWRAPRRRA